MSQVREKHFKCRARLPKITVTVTAKAGASVDPDWPMAGKRDIFKAQLSISNGLPYQTVLLYNKKKSVMSEIKAEADMLKLFRGSMKMFLTITYVKDPAGPNKYKLLVGSRVLDRDW
jgi:hypothetical protein